jgi:chromosome segregation ATPase
MTETAIMQTDLDRLAERVEKAAHLVQQLRQDQARIEREKSDLATRLQELEQKLQGQDPGALVLELSALRREQRDWQTERRDIAGRIETLLRKLEKLET